jgi:hypothetical protein
VQFTWDRRDRASSPSSGDRKNHRWDDNHPVLSLNHSCLSPPQQIRFLRVLRIENSGEIAGMTLFVMVFDPIIEQPMKRNGV